MAPSTSSCSLIRARGTNPTDPNSIGSNQDPAKVKRYASYIRFAYQTADKAVKQIADAAGRDSNVIVVSDHGFAPFHTSVNLTNILRNAGIDTSKIGIRTSGPARRHLRSICRTASSVAPSIWRPIARWWRRSLTP
jgi:predicted AlkP superfamily pyrophosphatase or phosphodiesterase